MILLVACSNSEEQVILNNSKESKNLILFGNERSISKLIKNKGFDFLINEALFHENDINEELIIGCEFEKNKLEVKFKNNEFDIISKKKSNIYARTFNTSVGDEYISSGNNDTSAITRIQLANYCHEVIYIPFPVIVPVVTPIVEKVYINIYFDNVTTQNIWGPAYSEAIDEWNAVLNDNTVNTYLDGSPQIYFRIAPENNLDYGNIEVLRVTSSELVSSNSFAEARLGRYREVVSGSGIFKHTIGKTMWVNKDKEGTLSLDQKKNVLLHELGHSVGFYHTSTQASNIEGTSQSSPSIFNMRDGIFRDQDLIAIDRIFNVPIEFVEVQGGCD
ncbi:hypothetical protein Q4Q34_15910 [Flavivirga abyssicola]|uniref:hypothetical protein n=1 Tax=Flavivirga abyssicola TaxID=3063533 RepID=UPI002ED33981|nr:hypothetical protein Q4Q34_15910 [Flavivirga sp. MEBiC07777]